VKQVGLYQSDREQLIAALNAKHAESVAFYTEAQRLTSVVGDLTTGNERLERDHYAMSAQYEEKQKSLVRALNELSVYRRSQFETNGPPSVSFRRAICVAL